MFRKNSGWESDTDPQRQCFRRVERGFEISTLLPYGCAEQTASKIGVLSWSKDFFRDESLQGRAKLFIREGERKLSRMVNYGGEINYWLNGNYVEPYSSNLMQVMFYWS